MKARQVIVVLSLLAVITVGLAILFQPNRLLPTDEKNAAILLLRSVVTGEELPGGVPDPRSAESKDFGKARQAYVAFRNLRELPQLPILPQCEFTAVTYDELKQLYASNEDEQRVFVLIQWECDKQYNATILRKTGGDSFDFRIDRKSKDLEFLGQLRWSERGSRVQASAF